MQQPSWTDGNTCQTWDEKYKRKIILSRQRSRKEDIIKRGIREREYQDNAWFHLAQDAVHWRDHVNTVIKLASIKIG